MKANRIAPTMMTLPALIAIMVALSAAPVAAKNSGGSRSAVKTLTECRLIKYKILTAGNVRIAVNGSTILLTGTVPTIFQKKEAGKLAMDAGKDLAVVNDLTVAPPPTSDSLIQADVMRRIHRNVVYTVFDWASATSRKGVVTLKGWVRNPWDVGEYQKQAEHVVGVRKVMNHLSVAIGYGHLARRAVRLIYRQGVFLGYSLKLNPPVHVIAVDGSVLLEGKIFSSGFGSYLADLVRYHTNAIHVVNDLHSPA